MVLLRWVARFGVSAASALRHARSPLSEKSLLSRGTGAALGRSECAQTPAQHSSGKNKNPLQPSPSPHYSSHAPEGLGNSPKQSKNRMTKKKNPNFQNTKLVRISALRVQADFSI